MESGGRKNIHERSVMLSKFIDLTTLGPTGDTEELEPLLSAIDNARVIAIGESTHYSHEFYELRNRLSRFLIERAGISAIVWESGFSEAVRVDNWVTGGADDLGEVLKHGFTYSFGQCTEMKDQVEWLRRLNARKTEPVNVYGLDLSASSSSIVPAVDAVAAYLRDVDPNSTDRVSGLDRLSRLYGDDPMPETDAQRRAALKAYAELSAANRNEITALLADLAARFDALRFTYIARSSSASYDLARQHLRMATKLDAFLRDSLRAPKHLITDASIRDGAMAEAVEWILEREARILILAHNVHIQRTSYRIPWLEDPGNPMPITPMGEFLAESLGSDYFVIGTTCGGGQAIGVEPEGDDDPLGTRYVVATLPEIREDTIDGLLAVAWETPAVADLRALSKQEKEWISPAKWMRCLDQRIEVSIASAFDLLVHVPSVSVWQARATSDLHEGASPMSAIAH